MEEFSYWHDIDTLTAIVDNMVDGIIVINTRGIILDVNPATCKIFDYEKEELIHQKVNILMPAIHAARHEEYIQNYLQTGIGKIIGIGREVEGVKKSGQRFSFHLSVSKISINEKILFVGLVHDLTEVKKYQAELEELNEMLERKVDERTYEIEKIINQLLEINRQLEQEIEERKKAEELLKIQGIELQKSLDKERELNDLKNRFISIASHEFRTPLATIQSSASLISKYPLTEDHSKREKHLHKIKSAVLNLTGILNDFLSVSKLEEGKLIPNFATHHFKKLILNIISDIDGLLKERQTLKKLVLIDDDVMIYTDEHILKNLFYNLISNAIKYSPIDGTISCKITDETDHYLICIEDNGIGIPLEEQKHIFGRFFRASNALNIHGTGLGLNISKKYAELLNGSISFESTPGQGTKFFLHLNK